MLIVGGVCTASRTWPTFHTISKFWGVGGDGVATIAGVTSDSVFIVVFSSEAAMKILALGWHRYLLID